MYTGKNITVDANTLYDIDLRLNLEQATMILALLLYCNFDIYDNAGYVQLRATDTGGVTLINGSHEEEKIISSFFIPISSTTRKFYNLESFNTFSGTQILEMRNGVLHSGLYSKFGITGDFQIDALMFS